MKLKPRYFLVFSLIFFSISLSQRCYCIDNDCGELMTGLIILLTGLFGLSVGGACLTWLANPLLLVSWITYQKYPKISLATSLLAMIVGLSFLTFKEIIINEAGHFGQITGYALGYWFWILSILLLVLGNIYLRIKERI